VIIGKPEEAKVRFHRSSTVRRLKILKAAGVKRFGLHTMVASNELNGDFFVETARMVFDLAVRIHQQLGVRMEFVNLGGGIGIPYRPEHKPCRSAGCRPGREEVVRADDRRNSAGSAEGHDGKRPHDHRAAWFPGHEAIHHKHIYRDYVGVDACMSNLMRPGMYGAYHHITVLGKENAPHDRIVDVVGSLCENNDKFAINRELPAVERGDLLGDS
jgi:diaminopimelate decarboxylase